MDHDYKQRKKNCKRAELACLERMNASRFSAEGYNRYERRAGKARAHRGVRGRMRRDWLAGVRQVPHGRSYRERALAEALRG